MKMRENYLVENFDALLRVIQLVDAEFVSFYKIQELMQKEFSQESVSVALNYYINTVMKVDAKPKAMFVSNEFDGLGPEVSSMINLSISNGIISYAKTQEVLERVAFMSLAGQVNLKDIKRIFASAIFNGAKNNITNFILS